MKKDITIRLLQDALETSRKIQNTVGNWLCNCAEHRQPFDEIKHRHTPKEINDVAEGAYDWKIVISIFFISSTVTNKILQK